MFHALVRISKDNFQNRLILPLHIFNPEQIYFFFPLLPVCLLAQSSLRRKLRLSNLLDQELNNCIPTSRCMQIMRNHNQLNIWQNSLRDLSDLFFFLVEPFA